VTQNKSLTCPSEKMVETVGTTETVMESMMAEVAQLSSVQHHIPAAIKKSTDFEWMFVLAVHFTTNE
jgi:hypothetical protein